MNTLRMTEAEYAERIAKRPRAFVERTVEPAPIQTPMQRVQALGRLPVGAMNKTERAWADKLEAQRIAGLIRSWQFEAITFRLAPKTSLTPDFFVVDNWGNIFFDEVKGGYVTDDGWAKLKIAAAMFPMFMFRKVQRKTKRNGGGWAITEIGA